MVTEDTPVRREQVDAIRRQESVQYFQPATDIRETNEEVVLTFDMHMSRTPLKHKKSLRAINRCIVLFLVYTAIGGFRPAVGQDHREHRNSSRTWQSLLVGGRKGFTGGDRRQIGARSCSRRLFS